MDYVATSSRRNADNEWDYTREFTASTNETFKSKEELINWAKEVGRSNNITVVVLRSDSGNGKKKATVTLACEKSGKCDIRKKMTGTGTKKSDCPFRLRGNKLGAADEWELKVVNGKHNHEAGHPGKGHSFLGSLSQEEKLLVKDLRKEGKQPKEILRVLQKRDKHNKSTPRTIYNACQRVKRIKPFEGFSSRLQRVMSSRKAEEYGFIKKQRTSPKMDTASDFFFTHPTCLELLLAFPTVFIIDFVSGWWYRASGARLKILGVASTGTYFSIGLAILGSKSTSSYEWALSSLHGVINDYGITMPDIVIVDTWGNDIEPAHIMKAVSDVFSRAKLLFTGNTIRSRVSYASNGGEWNSFYNKWKLLVESPTEEDWKENIMQLRTEVPDSVIDTLVKPYKEMFVPAWTDKVMHFGNTYPILNFLLGTNRTMCGYNMLWTHLLGVVVEQTVTDQIWEDLHELIEDENACVKALLEESLEKEYNDQDGFPELKELHGTISIRALDIIRKEAMLAKEMDDNHRENCSCAIRSTHGLPCAHVIAKYRREDRPIPPECIHSHWRTLELKPLRKTGEPNDVEGSVERRRLNEEMNTDTHTVLPLLDDIVEFERNSPNAGPSIVPSTQERHPDDEVHVIPSTKQLEFLDICPPEMRPYILDVKDVPRDGHCGFRAIASLMGYSEEVGWVKVREDITNELLLNLVHYAQLFGSDERVDELLQALANFESICLEKKHWMTMPDMGHIIASCYNIVLIHLSSAQCFTFFPLRTAPISISVSSPIEIVVGFVRDHFVQVYLKKGHPMPPPIRAPARKNLHSATIWERFHEQRSTEWATPYLSRIEQFASLQPEVVPQRNPIPIYHDLDPNLSFVAIQM